MKELKKTQEFFLIIFIGGNLDLELILRLWIEYTLRKFTIISKKKELLKKKLGGGELGSVLYILKSIEVDNVLIDSLYKLT